MFIVDFVVWKHLTTGPARCRGSGSSFSLIMICTMLNGAGFLWDIFGPVPLYGGIAPQLLLGKSLNQENLAPRIEVGQFIANGC